MALADSGPWAIVIGMLVGELAGTILSWHYVRLRPTFRLQRSVVTALLTYGSAVLGLKVLSAVFTSGDDLVQRGVSSLTVRGVTMWHAGDASGAA